jgi:tetratricopeptide (TPR) repeat protein
MNTEWIEAYAKLLSVPPLFDEAIAKDLVSSLSNELANGSSTAGDFLTSLRLTGLLMGERDCWQITDSARSEFRKILVDENPDLFQRALTISINHMENSFASTLQRTFGARNAKLLILTLNLGRGTGDRVAFDRVIRQLTEGHRLGRASGEAIARVALSQLPPEPDRFRQMDFLIGMQEWRLHRRQRAQRYFNRVLTAGISDLADAISSHLVGAAMSRRGEHSEAVTLLQRSVATLKELQDNHGLCQVLISLGIAEREISARLISEADDEELDTSESAALIAEADNHFQAAQDALDEAAGLANDLQDRHLEAGAHLELAACFARWSDIDTAIHESETARKIISPNDREYVRVLTQLGSLYRQNGDYDRAGEVLGEAARLAPAHGAESIELARLLNVQSANERRIGRLDAARSYAMSSVEIGRRLKDDRHLGHSLHTLARITAEQAQSSAELIRAGELLQASEQIFEVFHDSVGLGMISNTRGYIERRRAELNTETI